MLGAIRILSLLAIVSAVLSHLWVWGYLHLSLENRWWADGIWWRLVSVGLVFNAVATLLLTRKGKP